MKDVTTYLQESTAGDRGARDRLFASIYEELHGQATRHFQKERPGHTLQTTALVHEVWLKLVDQEDVDYKCKSHFLAVASTAMRRVLVDHARRSGRRKRGGDQRPVRLTDDIQATEERIGPADLVAIDEALEKLRVRSERLVRIVEMHFYGGLTMEQIAGVEGKHRATIVRDWRAARSLLTGYLRGTPDIVD